MVDGAGRWVWVNAGAWLVGVMIPMLALTMTPNGWPAWMHVVAGVAGAVLMGLTVGAITGSTLQRLLTGGVRDRARSSAR